jgi:hypothetical protein
MTGGINFLFEDFAANIQLNFPFHSGENNLVDEMINKNVSMITTSHDFVRIKNGTEIASPTNCIITPNDRFTWRMMKYAVTTRNDPMTLPAVSIFICDVPVKESKDNEMIHLLCHNHHQTIYHIRHHCADQNNRLLDGLIQDHICQVLLSSYLSGAEL